jgi:peptide deformylase
MASEVVAMAILPIVRLGHPALRTPAEAVSPERVPEPSFQRLIEDMIETMHDAEGVGLAAPQVGFGLQLFVYEAPELAGGRAVPLRVLINPMVEPEPGDLVYDWEGCLSIPDLRGLVPRHPAVRVRGLDRAGAAVDFLAEGFEARIVQHEFDHLNGVVFLDRMRDLQSLAFYEEWESYLHGEEPGKRPVPPE